MLEQKNIFSLKDQKLSFGTVDKETAVQFLVCVIVDWSKAWSSETLLAEAKARRKAVFHDKNCNEAC